MGAIQAIETVYHGYRFRSRLEARWAVFFDALGVPFEYEKEGFSLSPFPEEKGYVGKGIRSTGTLDYLPDFWLPSQQTWFEVKGQVPTDEEDLKAARLAHWSECDVVIAAGPIPVKSNDLFDRVPGAADWTCRFEKYFGDFGWDAPHVPTTCRTCNWFGFEFPNGDRARCNCSPIHHTSDYWSDRLATAYAAARSARFEHDQRELRAT